MSTFVVCGASRDIGYHVAKHLHNLGNKIINISRNLCDIDGVDNYCLDITDYDMLCDAVFCISENYPVIDGLVYAVGLTESGSIPEMSLEMFDTLQKVNMYGFFYVVKAFYDIFTKQRYGSIVQINSKTGKKGSYKNSAYAASKFGELGLVQSFALELVEYGIRVNAVCPGNVFETSTWKDKLFIQYGHNQGLTPEQVRKKYIDLVPMKRSCKYEDIANMVEFLLSNKSSYMTGQAINVTGGQQLF